MSDSKRLATLKALTTHLETDITEANGYDVDLTGKVMRGRMTFTDDDPLPMVAINDGLNPDRFPNRAGDEDSVETEQRDNWTINVQGWAVDDKDNPTDAAFELMAAVKKSLAKIRACRGSDGSPMYPESYMLGGLIAGLEYEPGTVRPPEQPSAKAFFWMRVILKFVENVNDPFDHH